MLEVVAPTVETVEYRNALYQGSVREMQPHGIGLLLDDYMRFYASEWNHGQLSGRSLVYCTHSSYIYGMWREGKPNGFNVMRSGDIVLLASLSNGQIRGQFIVIFERQNLMTIVQRDDEGKYFIRNKLQFLTEQDVRKVSETLSFGADMPQDFYSLIKFVKASFLQVDGGGIRLTFDGAEYRFGYEIGLAIMFNDENYVSRMGWLDNRNENIGIGGRFSTAGNEQGNFNNKSIIKYKQYRPQKQIKELLVHEHRRSVHFNNDYVDVGGIKIFKDLEAILRTQVIDSLSNNEPNKYPQGELNDSLEYYPKSKEEALRLQMIRQSLYRTPGRAGGEMIPATRDPVMRNNKQPNVPKNLHFTPEKSKISETYTLEESHKEILESVAPYLYEPVDRRIERLKIQRQIEVSTRPPEVSRLQPVMQSSQIRSPQRIYSRVQERQTNHSPIVALQSNRKAPLEETTAKKRQIFPPKESPKPKRKQPRFAQDSLDQGSQNQIADRVQRKSNAFERVATEQQPLKNSHPVQTYSEPINTHKSPAKRTPGKTVHRTPKPQIEEQPQFMKPESPHTNINISATENTLNLNPSSRKLIPVVHLPQKSISPAKPVGTIGYAQLHKKEKQRISKLSPNKDPSVSGSRTLMEQPPILSQPPIIASQPPALSPSRIPKPGTYPPIYHNQPSYYENELNNPSHLLLKQQKQRIVAAETIAKKYEYLKQL